LNILGRFDIIHFLHIKLVSIYGEMQKYVLILDNIVIAYCICGVF
jgi:hypothetical protein